MTLTNHAQARFQQRGFDDLIIFILNILGTCEIAPGGALLLTLPHKNAKRAIEEINRITKKIIRAIEKSRGRAAVLAQEKDIVITLIIKQ